MTSQDIEVRRAVVSRAHVPKPLEELGVVIGVEEESGRELIVIPPAVREAMNVLDPVQSFAQARPDWSPAVRVVQLDPDVKDGPHFYKQAGGKLAPTKQALELLAKAANIEVATTRRMPKEELADGERLGYYAKVRIRTASGTLEELERSQTFVEEAELEEIKTAVTNAKVWQNGQSTDKPKFDLPGTPQWEAEVRKRWLAELKNSSAKTESKAVLRAIRAALQIPHTFAPARAGLPFVVIGFNFTPDQSDPEVRRMLIAAGVNAASALYGSEHPTETPALPAGATPATDAAPEQGGAAEPGRPEAPGDTAGGQQAAEEPVSSAVPGPDDDKEPTLASTFQPPAAVIDAAAATQVPRGPKDVKGKPLSEIAADAHGADWLLWAMSKAPGYWPAVFRDALEMFVQHRAPDVWAKYVEQRDAA